MEENERTQKIERYGRGFNLLTKALEQIPREAWKFKAAEADWSIHEIIIHLADSETNSSLRARMIVAEPDGRLMGYDENAWAKKLNYHEQDPDDALQTVRYARLRTYKWLKSLPDSVWSNSAVHPEFSTPYTLERWLEIYAEHIPNHVEQMKRSYAAWQNQ